MRVISSVGQRTSSALGEDELLGTNAKIGLSTTVATDGAF